MTETLLFGTFLQSLLFADLGGRRAFAAGESQWSTWPNADPQKAANSPRASAMQLLGLSPVCFDLFINDLGRMNRRILTTPWRSQKKKIAKNQLY
ncbi:MAG: hypothetical protein ACSHXI_20630 [Hoeflea sp.]|uniref:hypothetical protein n=1 Tax=Hoeflea sp. TaxID=1940281 RepID=UPI003EF6FAF6